LRVSHFETFKNCYSQLAQLRISGKEYTLDSKMFKVLANVPSIVASLRELTLSCVFGVGNPQCLEQIACFTNLEKLDIYMVSKPFYVVAPQS
jgi:hypothetical protein